MPFVLVNKAKAMPAVGHDNVVVSYRKPPSTSTTSLISIEFGLGVIEELLWKEKQNVHIYAGADADAGQLKMVPNVDGNFCIAPNKGKTIWRVIVSQSILPGFTIKRSARRQIVKFTIDESYIQIDLTSVWDRAVKVA